VSEKTNSPALLSALLAVVAGLVAVLASHDAADWLLVLLVLVILALAFATGGAWRRDRAR
jgi:thiosulfate reductase cytochrome b subunit